MIDETVVDTALKELGAPVLDIVNGAMTLMSVFTGKKPSTSSSMSDPVPANSESDSTGGTTTTSPFSMTGSYSSMFGQ